MTRIIDDGIEKDIFYFEIRTANAIGNFNGWVAALHWTWKVGKRRIFQHIPIDQGDPQPAFDAAHADTHRLHNNLQIGIYNAYMEKKKREYREVYNQ